MANRWGKVGNHGRFYFLGFQNHYRCLTEATKLKDSCCLEEKLDKPRQHMNKQRCNFSDKGQYSQSYDFSSITYGCETCTIKKAECQRIDAFKLWCCRRLLRALDSKEIKRVNPNGKQSWIFIGRTEAKVKAPILWPPDVKGQLIGKGPDPGKDWGQEEKEVTEDEMVR